MYRYFGLLFWLGALLLVAGSFMAFNYSGLLQFAGVNIAVLGGYAHGALSEHRRLVGDK